MSAASVAAPRAPARFRAAAAVTTLAAASAAVLLGGCGQKGPLTLPKPAAPAASAAAAPAR